VGLLLEAAARQRADLAQKSPAWNGPQPDVWPEKYFFTFKHRNLEYVAGQEVVWDLEAGISFGCSQERKTANYRIIR
jgi:hypothetical protein